MSDNTTEELIIRWMDGENMNEKEINLLKKVHAEEPEMILNPQEFAEIRTQLRETLPSDQEIPNPELFNNTLLNRIEREEQEAARLLSLEDKILEFESAPPTEKRIVEYPWKMIIAGMAACLFFGLIIGNPFDSKKKRTLMADTQMPTAVNVTPVMYSAHENVSADFFNEGQTNVIVIEGLEAIPNDLDLFSLAQQNTPTPQNTPIKVIPNKSYPLDETN